MKKVLLTTIICSFFSFSFAGGFLTNTNQNIRFLRNPARDGSIGIDAVYSNPAGLAFLQNDGLHLSLNVQSAYQTRTITSTFAPFAGFGGAPTKGYKGEAAAPFIPSVQAAYKKDKWTFSGSFAITGGGGKATFNHGLPSFEAPISMIPISLSANTALPIPTTQYSVDSYMEGSQIIYGLQLGVTYKPVDYLSVYYGLRSNFVNNGYVGHIKNIKINPNQPLLNLNGDMISASNFFTAIGNSAMAASVGDKNLDCEQTGWGETLILGLDFNWNKLNVGLKYELNTHLNVENKTKVDDTGLFTDGVNTPHDIPALFTAGVSYEILPTLKVSVGYHYFFDKQAKMAGDKQKLLKGGTNEYLAGLEWDVLKWLQISAGVQRTKYGLADEYMADMSFNLHAYNYGMGAGFKLTEKLNLNVAYFLSDYEDYTKPTNYVPAASIPGTDIFSRTNKVFGIGLDYRF
ncbi:MAG: outer membrane protein transport protein [Prevotellaceae bacterium]|jgi:long-chain fatty acid transport protein|nr:outer membrane protein transport protein [Prevotellaceae bacterium]